MKELLEAFRGLKGAPRALWILIFAYAIDSMAYFGVLPLMKLFIQQEVGVAKVYASTWVSLFTAMLTLVMLFVGKPIDEKLGIRWGGILGLGLAVAGRAVYAGAPAFGGGSSIAALAMGLVIVALAEGVLQPVAYAGIKRYTTPANASMGYAVLYALFNLGGALMGPISAEVRTTWDARREAGISATSGFGAVNWVCVAITLVGLALFAFGMTKRTEEEGAKSGRAESASRSSSKDGEGRGEDDASAPQAAPSGRPPYRDARFLFFIFALLPVRTLFAHQWLTMPDYVMSAYPKEVGDKMEWFVDSINPTVIFFAVPLVAAVTRRVPVLTMMILGTGVSALATFLLVPGTSVGMLVAYFVVFSIGEALWSSRFFDYVGELAPEGRAAQYMGVANLPWFVAKATTGLYSGWMLQTFVPGDGGGSPGTMWMIYGGVGLVSPIALILARRWVSAGMKPTTA